MIIIIPGKPKPQARHRTYFHGSRCQYVDPSARDKLVMRNCINSYLDEHYPEFEMLNSPRVSFLFHFPIPKTFPKKLRRLAEKGLIKHEKKPDIDNLVKLCLDSLTKIIYQDDKAVSLGPSIKTYHEHPKTIIHIEESSDLLYPWELKPLVYNPDNEYPPPECKCHRTGCLGGEQALWTEKRSVMACDRCQDKNPAALEQFMSNWEKLHFEA